LLKIDEKNPVHINVFKAYKELQILDSLLHESGFSYCLCGGSLLGCIRHGFIMPWDDDIDIMMDENDLPSFENIARESGYIVSRLSRVPQVHNKGPIFPYIVQLNRDWICLELWPSRRKGDLLETCAGSYKYEEVFPLRRAEFSGVQLNIPQAPEVFLDRCYSRTNWRTTIVKRIDGHFSKRFTFEPFNGKIPSLKEVPD